MDDKEKWYLNHYECSECGQEWQDVWTCQCDDRCPSCDTSCSPTSSEDAEES